MYIDSVVGIPLPEPTALCVLILPALFIKRTRC
jgi:hypothetical protein